MPTHPKTTIALAMSAAILLLAGCGGGPAPETGAAFDVPDDLYVDWDHADWRVDRFIMVNVRDFVVAQGLAVDDPAAEYRKAVTYEAEWDSLGLIAFLSINDAEQAERRRLSRGHVREARRIMLGTVNGYWSRSIDGHLPFLSQVEPAIAPEGAETAVTTTLGHLVTATGLDPSNAAAWRDRAYFHGVIGDRTNQQRALTAALVALDQVDPEQRATGDVARLRRDVFLDLAWLARDLGQPDLALAYLDHVATWLPVASPEREVREFEGALLRGLALADQGEWLEAVTLARQMPRIEVVSRRLRAGVRDDLRWLLDEPNAEQLGYNRTNWPRVSSDFGRRWVKALAGAPSGDADHTLWMLGPPPTHLEFPPRLAWRYWQDQGRLYARAKDFDAARHCFEWAMMYRPYMAFFPLRGTTRPPARLATAEASDRYFTGYGLFFLCGDRGAFDRDAGPASIGSNRIGPLTLR
jgi:tetratricopeptide (TPR) repeat protein